MEKEFDYIIVGAGLCGMVLAKELSKRNKKVLILERGSFVNKLGTIRRVLSFYDRGLGLIRTKHKVIIYRAYGVGGTSIVSCGNAVEFTDEEYERIGIPLKGELEEAKRDCFVRGEGLKIGAASAKIMEAANILGYDMKPMPKFNISGTCAACGDCYLGCRYGMKWTARKCLEDLNQEVAHLIRGICVEKIIEYNGRAIGVEVRTSRLIKQRFFADKIILSAGGIGTPIILQNSGIGAGDKLFVDLFNVTYGISEEFSQKRELTMSVVCDKFHRDKGFVLSPFVDCWLAFYTSAKPADRWKMFKLDRMMGIMTKIADESVGKVHRNGRVDKFPTETDLAKLKKGSDIAREVLKHCGVDPKGIFVTEPSGAHPGGTAGIGRVVDKNLQTQLKNLYVCDASVLPFAPGLPPMLSLIALGKWFGKRI